MNLFKHIVLFFTFISLRNFATASKSKVHKVRCAVCRSLMVELRDEYLKVDQRKTLDIGSRIENTKKTKYAGSELHMIELFEKICSAFDDYAQAVHKATSRFELMKLVVNGKMNPRFTEYELIQDPDLNKGLGEQCTSISEDYEEKIIEFIKGEATKFDDDFLLQDEFCSRITDLCPAEEMIVKPGEQPIVRLPEQEEMGLPEDPKEEQEEEEIQAEEKKTEL